MCLTITFGREEASTVQTALKQAVKECDVIESLTTQWNDFQKILEVHS